MEYFEKKIKANDDNMQMIEWLFTRCYFHIPTKVMMIFVAIMVIITINLTKYKIILLLMYYISNIIMSNIIIVIIQN